MVAKLVMTKAMVVMVAAALAAGGGLVDGRGHGSGQGNHGDGSEEEFLRDGHGLGLG